jgi:hypothetical protein
MKLFVKLMIAAVVLAVLMPFTFLKGKDGNPLMSLDRLKAPELSMPQLAGDNISRGTGREDIIYQWRDADGEINFTSSPPPEGIQYTSKGYDPDTNLIQSISVKEEQSEILETPAAATQIKKPADIGNPYSPQNVEKLINDAQGVQQVLNDRLKQQEALIGR